MSGACGFTWEVGERVGAFLDREAAAWTTNLCSLVEPAELERRAGALSAAHAATAAWRCWPAAASRTPV